MRARDEKGEVVFFFVLSPPGSAFRTPCHRVYAAVWTLSLSRVELFSLWVHRLVMCNRLLITRQRHTATLFNAQD